MKGLHLALSAEDKGQFKYEVNEEALVLGHNTSIIKLDKIHEY